MKVKQLKSSLILTAGLRVLMAAVVLGICETSPALAANASPASALNVGATPSIAPGADAEAFPVRFQPEVSVSFPQPLQIGTQMECRGELIFCDSHVRYYIDGGYFTLPLGANGSKNLSLYSFELGTRYFPFSAPIYLSAGVGYRHIAFSGDMSAFQLDSETVATSANLDLSTFYVSPAVGFNLGLTRHLSFGMDLGAQIPLIASGRIWLYNANNGQSSDTSSELQVDSGTATNRIAGLIIPKLTLIRLTYNLD